MTPKASAAVPTAELSTAAGSIAGLRSEVSAVARHSMIADGSPAPDFTSVYQTEFDFVWRCLRALGVATADLDDAAQEVFVILHQRLAALSKPNELRSWLYGVVRNVATNHRRGVRRKAASVMALQHEPTALISTPLGSTPFGSTPFDSALTQEAATSLDEFLVQLDADRREVFVLAEFEEWTIPEVAQATGMPLNTAYSRLRSARLEFERFIANKRGPENG